ncbi:MAG: double-strand break repair protein AddB [Parvibaculales bacterium]
MDRDSLNIFNLPAGAPFLDRLSDGLTRDLTFGGVLAPGFALHDFLILLPTRRAVRELRQALVDKADTDSLLLPDIKPLADIDETDLFFNVTDPAVLELPPVLPQLRREGFFISEILNWEAEAGTDKTQSGSITKAAALAADLASFLNQAQTEEINLDDLQNLVDDQFAQNWQQTVAFLSILTAKWPAYRDQAGGADPSEHRNRLLRLQARQWRDAQPTKPVIAAGSTGSIPATADLLKQILDLPNGMVILPGLDTELSPETWALLAKQDAHPQSGLYHLLKRLDVPRSRVRTFGSQGGILQKDGNSARRAFLSMALLPSDHTIQWTRAGDSIPDLDTALAGLHYHEAADMRREAEVIALALREALEVEGKTAVLVTPDRNLARRVAASLKRWDIEINDTAGLALADTSIGILTRLSLEAVSSGFAPVQLLSVLKQQDVCLHEDRQTYLDHVQQMERLLLRGPRLSSGLGGLLQRLDWLKRADDSNDKRPDYAAIRTLLERAENAFAPLVKLGSAATVRDIAGVLPSVLAGLTGQDLSHDIGRDSGRTDEAQGHGEDVHNLLEDLSQIDIGEVPASEWAELFAHWLAQRQTRSGRGLHPRLSIMGLLEARLVHADLIVLGGLNEGVWPHLPDTGPWVSRPMRTQLGMTSPERRIGLMAHDFVQAACAPQVLMTRSKKSGGTPMVASRWLTRMQALAKGISGKDQGLPGADRLAGLAAALEPASVGHITEKPMPAPPVQVRPKRLSVTQVEKLQRNPYAVYARHILGLKKLDLPDARSSGAVRGTLIHNVLEGFAKATAEGLPENSSALVAELVAQYSKDMPGGQGIMTYWDARLKALTQWLVGFETQRRAGVEKIYAEVKGTRTFTVEGRDFTLSAIADRIELLKDHSLSVLDYKTYRPPNASDVRSQKAPQLLLESLIAQTGGFEDVPAGKVSSLAYLHVSGGHPAGDLLEVEKFETALEEAEAGLISLIASFNDSATPYPPHTQPKLILFGDDYDHLARLAEWSSRDGEET